MILYYKICFTSSVLQFWRFFYSFCIQFEDLGYAIQGFQVNFQCAHSYLPHLTSFSIAVKWCICFKMKFQFQNTTKNCQTQSSLSRVKNLDEEIKNYYDGDEISHWLMWIIILHAVNNNDDIWKWLGKSWKFFLSNFLSYSMAQQRRVFQLFCMQF